MCVCYCLDFFVFVVFLFKQHTAYEMRISDWSSTCALPIYDLYMKGSMYPATREPTEAEAERLAVIGAEIEAIARAEGEDSERIDPLSDEQDAITEGLRAFNSEQVAVGGVALWVAHDGSLGKSRSEEHTSELQSLMRISYAVFCLKKKKL